MARISDNPARGRSATRRLLRAELRSMRKASGKSIEEVTGEVEWSPSKLIRIEAGSVGISVSDLNALLTVYAITDTGRQKELRDLARATRQRMWWSEYQRYLLPAYLEFIGAESDAAHIRHYHPTIVPGLFQSPLYSKAIIATTSLEPLSHETAEARQEVRMLRQRHVLDREDPPMMTMILDETVVRRRVGNAETMREQLDHLIELARRNTVDLIFVPFDAGSHPGLMGAFALMQYADPEIEDVLFLENATGDMLLRNRPDAVEQYRRTADRLAEIGISEPDAIDYLVEVRNNIR